MLTSSPGELLNSLEGLLKSLFAKQTFLLAWIWAQHLLVLAGVPKGEKQ